MNREKLFPCVYRRSGRCGLHLLRASGRDSLKRGKQMDGALCGLCRDVFPILHGVKVKVVKGRGSPPHTYYNFTSDGERHRLQDRCGMVTICTKVRVNRGHYYGGERMVEFFHPATILASGRISGHSNPCLLVRQEECGELDVFTLTPRGFSHYQHLTRVYESPGWWLAYLHDTIENWGAPQPLGSSWLGTGTGPHDRPIVCPEVRLLLQKFNPASNKVKCYHCSNVALRKQFFHREGEPLVFLPVCNECIRDEEGWGRVFPPPSPG